MHTTSARPTFAPGNMSELILCGEHLQLLPQRAVWWAAKKTLILSDVHWGKSGHFRKAGIAMPIGTQAQDGQRLSQIVQQFTAERMIIAGDLFHSRFNNEVADFGHWRAAYSSLHIDFVMGNHDILTEAHYHEWNLTIHKDGMEEGPFFIAHDNEQHELFTIHGHIHPGVRLPGIGGETLPCFAIGSDCMALPAFGLFTGFKRVQLSEYNHLYVVGDGKVLQLK